MPFPSKLICKYIVKILQDYFRTRQSQSYSKLILWTKFKNTKKKNLKMKNNGRYLAISGIEIYYYKINSKQKGTCHQICRRSWTRTKSINRSPGNCVQGTGGSDRFLGQSCSIHPVPRTHNYAGNLNRSGLNPKPTSLPRLSPLPGDHSSLTVSRSHSTRC